MIRRFSMFLAAVLFCASTAHATSITVFTDISGANTQIDQANWTVWTFSLAPSATVEDILGSFMMKRGPSTDQPITFSLFDTDATGWTLAQINGATPVAAVSLAPAAVDNSFEIRDFALDPTPDLTNSALTYSLVLWSNTGTTGAYQFFFKADRNRTLFVTPCDVITGSNVECGDPELPDASMPEPSTVILTLTGFGLVALRRWRS